MITSSSSSAVALLRVYRLNSAVSCPPYLFHEIGYNLVVFSSVSIHSETLLDPPKLSIILPTFQTIDRVILYPSNELRLPVPSGVEESFVESTVKDLLELLHSFR